MQTFKRICVKTETFASGAEKQTLHRGREYITSRERDGKVTVFASPFWVYGVDASIFAGAEQFTPKDTTHER